MKAYFDNATGELLAVHDRPELAPHGSTEVPLRPGGELAARMENETRRFVMIGGVVHEQSGWEPLDMLPDLRWFAVQELDAEYARRMAGTYDGITDKPVPLIAAQSLANFATMSAVMAGGEDGTDEVAVEYPGGSVRLAWNDIAKHAAPFTRQVAKLQSWYWAKHAEIQASDDPAGVTL
jgi:hypothetical protein